MPRRLVSGYISHRNGWDEETGWVLCPDNAPCLALPSAPPPPNPPSPNLQSCCSKPSRQEQQLSIIWGEGGGGRCCQRQRKRPPSPQHRSHRADDDSPRGSVYSLNLALGFCRFVLFAILVVLIPLLVFLCRRSSLCWSACSKAMALLMLLMSLDAASRTFSLVMGFVIWLLGLVA